MTDPTLLTTHSLTDRSVTQYNLTKHHGLGNDFLIAIQPSRRLGPDDAVTWCDRRRGLGADGLIELTTHDDTATPVDGDAHVWSMILWNADGSRAEISGNGMRCVGQALIRASDQTDGHLVVRTDAGLRRLHVHATPDPLTHQVRVDMGVAGQGPPPSDRLSELGVEAHRQLGVDMGNPHLVVLVDDPATIDLAAVGPRVEADYPSGINVHFVRVDNPSTITLEVWERGAGLTEACGSGACAAAYAARQWGLTDATVKVSMVGGSAEVEVGDTIHLTGPATFVADISVADSAGRPGAARG